MKILLLLFLAQVAGEDRMPETDVIDCAKTPEHCIVLEVQEPPKPQIIKCVRKREGLAFTWPMPPTIITCEANGAKFIIEIENE